MFTIEQLKNAYTAYVKEARDHPEKFLSKEKTDKLPAHEEASLLIDWIVAKMEGRDPWL